MDLKSKHKTRFPAPDQAASLQVPKKSLDTHRQTRFPGGTELQKISILDANDPPTETKQEEEIITRALSRLPLKVNPPNGVPARPLPVMTIKTTRDGQPPTVRIESPWNTYTALRLLERGGEVTAACTHKVPVEMVAIKKLSSDYVKELAKCQHENLLAIVELYRSEGEFYVVTDYTMATLKQIIAITLPLEELHVSATCRQESSLSCAVGHLTNMPKVFEGMQHLSRFGLAHRKLDSSKVLFLSDGCAKIAYFDECQSTESAAARSIGVIAVEMMQNGIPPEADKKLTLKHPERWSPEASNFLEVTSWGTLKDIEKNRFLKCVSPTVMKPFVEYARWDTIESLNLPNE